MAACQSTSRRDRVMTGRLSDDFLRITTSAGQSVADGAQQSSLNPAYRLATGFVPAKTVGRLSVTVTQANLTKNYGLMKMDPYCRIRVGNTVFETPTDANGGKSPVWNRTIYCYLPSGVDSIYLEIFDERSFTIDERIAWAHVRIPEAVFKGDTIDEWYSLSGSQGDGKEGMVNLVMTLHVCIFVIL
ncbi:unnamed protein product [Soboliphyme baturini]|uniref:C2 domain-containing protein n=1 Tax=Soboliphyme baturini TaxID=241478 RepID=A0A183IWR7_9BILA|nr:unnamed protein product [Soboliphyme baturini]